MGDLVWAEEGTVVSARVRVDDVRVEASWRRRVQRTIARLSDETGQIEATWFGRRFIERRLQTWAGDRRLGPAEAVRPVADDRQPRVPGRRGRRRGAPRRPDRARLPVDGRADRRAPAGRDARGARPGRPRLPRVPARRTCAARNGSPASPTSLESAHYPESFEGRDAALRRLAFDELLALQLGMVGRRRARGRDRAPGGRGRRRRPTRRSAAALVDALGDASRPPGRADARPGRASIDAIRADLARLDADAAAPPGRRRLGQDRGGGLRPRGRRTSRLPGRTAGADRPARAAAPRHRRRAARGSGRRRAAAHRDRSTRATGRTPTTSSPPARPR